MGDVPMGWVMAPWHGRCPRGEALLCSLRHSKKKVPWSKPCSADGSSLCPALTNPPGMFFFLGSARAPSGTFHPMGGCLGTRVYLGTGLSGLMAHPPPQVGPEVLSPGCWARVAGGSRTVPSQAHMCMLSGLARRETCLFGHRNTAQETQKNLPSPAAIQLVPAAVPTRLTRRLVPLPDSFGAGRVRSGTSLAVVAGATAQV